MRTPRLVWNLLGLIFGALKSPPLQRKFLLWDLHSVYGNCFAVDCGEQVNRQYDAICCEVRECEAPSLAILQHKERVQVAVPGA